MELLSCHPYLSKVPDLNANVNFFLNTIPPVHLVVIVSGSKVTLRVVHGGEPPITGPWPLHAWLLLKW